MIWTAIAVTLVAWFIGLLLRVGPLANLLLVVQVINDREAES